MYEKQYIVFDRLKPEKPQLFSSKAELLPLLKADWLRFPEFTYTKIVEIEIEEFSSVSGHWVDVTEDFYNEAMRG